MSVAGGSMAGGGNNELIALALAGDDKFKARLKQLLEAKEAVRREREELRIGQDAKKLYEEAQAKEKEVALAIEGAQVAAKGLLEKAHIDAAEIVRGAEAKAAEIVKRAEGKAAMLTERAELLQQNAAMDNHQAKELLAIRKSDEKEAKRMRQQLEKQTIAAAEALSEATALKEQYAAAMAKLRAAAEGL